MTNEVLIAAAALGLDRDALARDAGLDPGELSDPDGRVPLVSHFRMWELLAAHAPPLGLELGARLGLAGMGVIGYAMQHGATVAEALAWQQRYRAVIHPDVVPAVEARGPHVVFARPVAAPFIRLREPVEAQAAAIVALMRALTGTAVRPAFVVLPLSRPVAAARQERWFACPITWSAPRLEVAFPLTVLATPLPRSDAHLFGYLARRADELRASLPAESTWSDRVRREVGTCLAHGEPRLADIAQRLGTSARTLHRRLDGEGTKLSTLLDDARRERALLVIEDRALSVGELAFLLGYAEPTTFIRAFKRWTGETPTSYRARAPSLRPRVVT